MSHTPGPWRVGKEETQVVSDKPTGWHADAISMKYYGGHLIAESVPPHLSTLIAAAPEMLAFIEKPYPIGAYQGWRRDGNTKDTDELNAYEDERRALIAKARGES